MTANSEIDERSPGIEIRIPAEIAAWQRVRASVTVRNPTGGVILLISLELRSALGPIAQWSFERVSDPYMEQQSMAPPSQASPTVQKELLMPGSSVVRSAEFDADYQHGDTLEATLDYVAQNSAGGHETTRQTAPLHIRHPSFDVDEARTLAGVSGGAFAYDPTTGSWLLFDEQRRRTLVVGEQGVTDEFPGNWIELLSVVGRGGETSISWNTEVVPLTDAITAALPGIRPFAHKGYVSATNFMLPIDSARIKKLARVLQEIGGRLDGLKVVK